MRKIFFDSLMNRIYLKNLEFSTTTLGCTDIFSVELSVFLYWKSLTNPCAEWACNSSLYQSWTKIGLVVKPGSFNTRTDNWSNLQIVSCPMSGDLETHFSWNVTSRSWKSARPEPPEMSIRVKDDAGLLVNQFKVLWKRGKYFVFRLLQILFFFKSFIVMNSQNITLLD